MKELIVSKTSRIVCVFFVGYGFTGDPMIGASRSDFENPLREEQGQGAEVK